MQIRILGRFHSEESRCGREWRCVLALVLMALYRTFYQKYLDVRGMPVVAHAEVADLALQRTYQIVTHMLAGRSDILAAMVSNHTYLIIIGKNQVYTDMPKYRNHPNPEFQNERVRDTGGNPTSFGEENLLSLPEQSGLARPTVALKPKHSIRHPSGRQPAVGSPLFVEDSGTDRRPLF